jgi:hypothetical protein
MNVYVRMIYSVLILCGVAWQSTSTAAEVTDIELLRAGQFEMLDSKFGSLQASYERGTLDDEDLRAAFRVFYDTRASLAPIYESWTSKFPRSYVAHLARGIYYKNEPVSIEINYSIVHPAESCLHSRPKALRPYADLDDVPDQTCRADHLPADGLFRTPAVVDGYRYLSSMELA